MLVEVLVEKESRPGVAVVYVVEALLVSTEEGDDTVIVVIVGMAVVVMLEYVTDVTDTDETPDKGKGKKEFDSFRDEFMLLCTASLLVCSITGDNDVKILLEFKGPLLWLCVVISDSAVVLVTVANVGPRIPLSPLT